MSSTIKAGIIGGAGYTGGELIRLLVNHPAVELTFIHSRSNAGQPVSAVHQDLLGETDLRFTDNLQKDIDVLKEKYPNSFELIKGSLDDLGLVQGEAAKADLVISTSPSSPRCCVISLYLG